MGSTGTEQTALMKEILESLKTLQINQARLASNVDSITGRVNVLAGIREVSDAAAAGPTNGAAKIVSSPDSIKEDAQEDANIPDSPSLTASELSQSHPTAVSHVRKASGGTSRIILT